MEAPQKLPTPHAHAPAQPTRRPRRYQPLKLLGVIAVCAATSAATVWIMLAAGWVKLDATQTITENRKKLVLQEGEIVADVFKKASPYTVAITTETPTLSRRMQQSVQEGAGSGIIISRDGYVLTNKHVIPEGASRVTVVLADGRELEDVKIIGRDPSNDIAFLKINGVADLPFAELGDSAAVEPGQKVVAVGNALGEFRNSVTAGIISGLGRPIEAALDDSNSEKLENLFQTDAAINPGNSGGPLVNLKGEVIGINTAIAEQAEGIGFAIPINDAKGLIASVLREGKLLKPYLGVRYITLTREAATELGLSVFKGAFINGDAANPGVVAGGPGTKAGLKDRDIITQVNDVELTEATSLGNVLARFAPGDKIKLAVLRDDKTISVDVTLEAYPNL